MNDLERNKETVTDFYQMAFDGEPERAVDMFVGERYIQHNPNTEDGTAPFIAYVRSLHESNTFVRLDIRRVIAERDLVMTHARLLTGSNGSGLALADIFRVEYGKVVEHWDVIQPIPEHSANFNGMV